MPWLQIDLRLPILVETPLHIGSGHGTGLIRKALVRFPDETRAARPYLPYVPGSALKGRVRNLCEDLARGLGLTVCGVPRVAEADEAARHSIDRCVICRIFGGIGRNSAEGRGLTWYNAYPPLGERDIVGEAVSRTHVQLSRTRGIAASDRLFAAEFTAPGLTFEGRVAGWLQSSEARAGSGRYREVALLLAGLGLVDALGGMRRRGAGRCHVLLPETITVMVDGREIRSTPGEALEGLDRLREAEDEDGHGA